MKLLSTNIAPRKKQIIYSKPNLGLEVLPMSNCGAVFGRGRTLIELQREDKIPIPQTIPNVGDTCKQEK